MLASDQLYRLTHAARNKHHSICVTFPLQVYAAFYFFHTRIIFANSTRDYRITNLTDSMLSNQPAFRLILFSTLKLFFFVLTLCFSTVFLVYFVLANKFDFI